MTVHLREFDSLRDLLDYSNEPTEQPNSDRSSQSTKENERDWYSGDSWYGTKDYATAEAMALNWSEGADMVTKFRATINKNTRVPKRVTQKSVVPPGVINIGAVVTGEPETYYRRQETSRLVKGSGKVIRVVVDASAHCGIGADTMQRRGAAVLALIDALEKSGRRCELTMVWSIAGGYGGRLEYRLTVKRASQRVSLNAMAFSVAHPSMFRRVVFSLMEHESKEIRSQFGITKHGGYGRPASSSLADIVKKNGGIYIPNDTYDFGNDARATEWVKKVAAEQGLTLKDRKG